MIDAKGIDMAQPIWLWGCPAFLVFLGCFWAYAGQPRQCSLHQSILLTHEIFTKKYWEMAELENDLFLGGHFEIFLLHLIKKTKGFHMRYHFFLYYGWFLQNLRKDFIRTNMHTTHDIKEILLCKVSLLHIISKFDFSVLKLDKISINQVVIVFQVFFLRHYIKIIKH